MLSIILLYSDPSTTIPLVRKYIHTALYIIYICYLSVPDQDSQSNLLRTYNKGKKVFHKLQGHLSFNKSFQCHGGEHQPLQEPEKHTNWKLKKYTSSNYIIDNKSIL